MIEVLQYKSNLNPPPQDAFQDILKQMGPLVPSDLNVLYVSDPRQIASSLKTGPCLL